MDRSSEYSKRVGGIASRIWRLGDSTRARQYWPRYFQAFEASFDALHLVVAASIVPNRKEVISIF